jgi:ketopantoate reductase
MTVVIFGGAGATGRRLAYCVLQLGHHVTVAVRKRAMPPVTHDRLRIAQCDGRGARVAEALAIERGKPALEYRKQKRVSTFALTR